MIQRRKFITLLGGAAVASPLAAPAQPPDRVLRVGVLMNLFAEDPESHARLAAFAQGLQELGWTVGRNIRLECRWADGNAETMRRYAAELVALAPDVILVHSSAAVAPLLQDTRIDSDRVHDCRRPGWCRLRQQFSAPGGQHHGLYQLGILPWAGNGLSS